MLALRLLPLLLVVASSLSANGYRILLKKMEMSGSAVYNGEEQQTSVQHGLLSLPLYCCTLALSVH